jgi:hypothetical protein
MLVGDEVCPVSDQLLGHLYRQTHSGLTELLRGMGAETRAKLALYCYARTHLREAGLMIAATCDRQNLISVGAQIGEAVFQRAQAAPEPAPVESHYVVRKRVTLASFISKVECVA